MFRNGIYLARRALTQCRRHRPIIVNLHRNLADVRCFRKTPPTKSGGPFASTGGATLGLSLLTLLGMEKNTVEDDIVLNLKRSILMIRQGKFDQAEQLLHLTLRMAQQTRNERAVTYIYDVMANLAFERNFSDKAEKLFVVVMQRLLAEGYAENDIKNVHISLKLARICQLKGEKEKARIGFEWCADCLEELVKSPELTDDVRILYALFKDWYGHYLFDLGHNERAFSLLEQSYEIMKDYRDDNPDNVVALLSDMATIKEKMNELKSAEEYLRSAIKLAEEIPKYRDLPVLYVNLGRLLLRMRLVVEARKSCGYALKLAADLKIKEYKTEASNCIKEALKATL